MKEKNKAGGGGGSTHAREEGSCTVFHNGNRLDLACTPLRTFRTLHMTMMISFQYAQGHFRPSLFYITQSIIFFLLSLPRSRSRSLSQIPRLTIRTRSLSLPRSAFCCVLLVVDLGLWGWFSSLSWLLRSL